MTKSQLFKVGLALTLGCNLTHCLSLWISMHPYISKTWEKRTSVDLVFKFTNKLLQKYALNFKLTQG